MYWKTATTTQSCITLIVFDPYQFLALFRASCRIVNTCFTPPPDGATNFCPVRTIALISCRWTCGELEEESRALSVFSHHTHTHFCQSSCWSEHWSIFPDSSSFKTLLINAASSRAVRVNFHWGSERKSSSQAAWALETGVCVATRPRRGQQTRQNTSCPVGKMHLSQRSEYEWVSFCTWRF